MTTDDLSLVLSSTRIGNVELRNRIVRTAYGTNLGRGQLNEDLIAHHEARARGGVGLSMVEATGIHPSGPLTLNGWEDSIVPRYALLSQRVRAFGMKIFGQLNHLGLAGPAKGERPWSASPLVTPAGQRAIGMSRAQIDDIVAAYASAALRTREGGLDGVEIHCAHGHLIQQFLSPVTNQRDDEYGGDWLGRVRFLIEVITHCREAVGKDFVLGVRVGPEDERMKISSEDCIRVVRELESRRLIDYVNISQGSFYVPEKIIGAMHEPPGYELGESRRIAAAATLPTIVTGRIRTLAEANRIVADGIATLVGMTRAHIADPDIVEKTRIGRAIDVRPCIACNQGCVGGLDRGRLGCTVNARAGREAMLEDATRPAREPKRVVVVGGGPAGLEAARVAASRGHVVTLFEEQAELGGALQIARKAPSHALIGDIADWLIRQVAALKVDVHLSTRADPHAIASLKPHAVILATGVTPQGTPLNAIARNAGLSCVSARKLLAGFQSRTVEHAVVCDESGAYEAIGAAELLQQRGASITFVTPFTRFAPKLESALVTQPALRRLRRGSFSLSVGAVISELRARGCIVQMQEGGEPKYIEADLLVTASPGIPDETLEPSFASLGVRTVKIGEARFPGATLESAIREGHDAAIALEA